MKKSAKKQEVADRVKEIKQRQQNWMKERAANKGNDASSDTPVVANGMVRKTARTTDEHHESSLSLSEDVLVSKKANAVVANGMVRKTARTTDEHHESSLSLSEDVLVSKKSNAKFQNWLKARERHNNTESNKRAHYSYQAYNSSDYSNNTERKGHTSSGSRGDVNVLSFSSSRSPQNASPDDGWNSDDETGEITAAQLMSPEDFDAVADNIIARVKGDLKVKESSKKPGFERSGADKDGAKLSSHVCPNCENLMVPPQNNPMLVVPCGHTLCRACSKKTKYCCICGCPAQSTTENSMLQRIITDFQSQERTRREEKQRNRRLYKEEYHNLMTRHEVLQEESVSISKNISKLTSKMTKEKDQIQSISQEEENILRKIKALQQQVQVLGEHRREYERIYEELESQTESEKKRLVLVRNSMMSVEEQIEKVKLLVESDE